MTQTVLRALQGLQPRRRLPGFACFLGALALAILAGCNSSGCGGMGGGSGYQVDGLPGLLSCSSTTSSTNGAGTTADVTMPTMIAQNTGFNSNASDPSGTVFYAMQPATGTLPTGGPVGTTATLTFATTGPVHPMTNPNDYTLNASITGLTPKCEIAMGGVVFADPTIYGPMTGTKGTLQINYPMFTGTGSFTINCIGAQGTAYTAQTSLTVTVP